MNEEIETTEQEAGRRLRAVFTALSAHCPTHEMTVDRYERALNEAYPAEGNDPSIVGSWAWWATHAGLVGR